MVMTIVMIFYAQIRKHFQENFSESNRSTSRIKIKNLQALCTEHPKLVSGNACLFILSAENETKRKISHLL